MISEEIKIRIARFHIRTLILVNYYSCYIGHRDEEFLCGGFDVFLHESSYNFINVLLHVFAVLGKDKEVTSLKSPGFYKCVDKYKIDIEPDDLILANITDLCRKEILSSQEDIAAKAINIFLKTIGNDDIVDLFKIREKIFLYENILQQLGKYIGNEHLFDFLYNIEEHFHRQRDFYVNICKVLYHEFEDTCVQILGNVKNWRLERIYILDKIIICIAFIESKVYNTPKPVLINEYIEIAKVFSTDKSGGFVNGILDSVIYLKS